MRDETLGTNAYTILDPEPTNSQSLSTRDHEIIAQGVKHIRPTMSDKKQKENQRITMHSIVFPHLLRKQSLRMCYVLGTTIDDKLFLKGSDSKYFRLCRSVSVTIGQRTNAAAIDSI